MRITGDKFYQRKKADEKLLDKYGDKLIKCAICGRPFVKVGAHVVQVHGYESAREYRKEFGFDTKRGQVIPEHREVLAQNVVKTGTIKNLEKGAKFRYKKGDKVGKYERSRQTLERLSHKEKGAW